MYTHMCSLLCTYVSWTPTDTTLSQFLTDPTRPRRAAAVPGVTTHPQTIFENPELRGFDSVGFLIFEGLEFPGPWDFFPQI